MEKNVFEKIYEAVKLIPKGKVSTYGEIARFCRISNPRIVGYALHANKTPIIIPCHRVVDRNGKLASGFAFGGIEAQKSLLENEGVFVKENLVDLSVYLFRYCDKL